MSNQPTNPNRQPANVVPMANYSLPQPYYPVPNQPIQNPPPQPQNPEELNRLLQTREINRLIPVHKGGSWGSLEYRPKHVSFATQNKGERVYILVRRHWITNIGWIINNSLFALLPFVLIEILKLVGFDTSLLANTNVYLILLAFYSVIFTNVIKEFFDWYYDPYILTNQRVLDYDFKPFTSYHINEADLSDIEDVQERSVGLLPSLFNYGDIEIRTASNRGLIQFKSVPNPTGVRDIISDLAKIAHRFNIYRPKND